MKSILMGFDEIVGVEEAAHIAGRSTKTIRRWVQAHGIGRQSMSNARIEISRVALLMMMQGDVEALELLRDGKRQDPLVLRFFDHLGLSPLLPSHSHIVQSCPTMSNISR